MRKDPNNYKEHRGDWTVWFGLLVFALIFFSVVLNFAGTRSWLCSGVPQDQSCTKAVISEFQTLITGLLAVGAAFLTVVAMRKSDDISERQHSEALAFGMRSEVRKMERALNPQVADLRAILNEVHRIDFGEAQFINHPGDPRFAYYSYVAERLAPLLEKVLEVLKRSAFLDAQDLFDGQLSHCLAQALRQFETVSGEMRGHLLIVCDPFCREEDDYNYMNMWEESGYLWVRRVQDVPVLLETLNNHLERAASEHERMSARFQQ